MGATIASVKAQLVAIQDTFKWGVKDKDAKEYESSKICQQDKVFEDYLSELNTKISDFRTQVRNISPPSNYNNTLDFKYEIDKNVEVGQNQFNDYATAVDTASRKVFEEYTSEFSRNLSLYTTCETRAKTALAKAQEAQTAADNYARAAAAANDTLDHSKAASYSSLASGKRADVTKYVGYAGRELPLLKTYIEGMQKVLEKGLQKL